MTYRDELGAARALAAKLEREVMERSASLATLRRYRNALFLEVTKLRHALTWYENGVRYGFNKFEERDDLSPALHDPPRVPGIEQLDRQLADLNADALAERTRELTRALGRGDPKVEWLREEIARLRAEILELRPKVEAYAARFPENSPPPEYNPLPVLVAGGAAVVAALLGLAFLL
jgi:phage shock protein A